MPPRDRWVITGSRRPGFPLAATSAYRPVALSALKAPSRQRFQAGRISRLRLPAMRIADASCDTGSMRLRCLIVDDNLGFLEAARTSLERQGLDVVGIATTGNQALSKAAALHPDVALADIALGEESGFELARRLVEALPDLQGRIVLISTRGEDEYADMVAASAAVGFLSKSHLSVSALRQLVADDAWPGPERAEPVGPSGPPRT
jgi:two-component system, NarL family, nitrate/nitrite response regulator NarL